ncbi:DgyrCDS11690 [Dimorphilus gyrociliatus]|uniref:DgyrCDS11690 n=1 Tax=Dimorphilus gyrociliatus TaxID=2664684 RepID=A0A7I8W455_9ANNE|nr:DgyrCDS11690 [Dimorphilus gyrociliatus]
MISMLENRSSTVPAFLNKLCTLLDDETTDDMICWDASGKSFHLLDQNRFAKDILPMYFKTSNIASFIRQLNMYGFKKVVHMNSGIKYEKEDVEFQHPHFIRGKEELLELIKRKGVQPKFEEVGRPRESEDYSKICQNVKNLAKKHEVVSNQFDSIKRENVALWREVAILRQKHKVQQEILNNVIRFLLSMVGKRQMPSTKRKIPMLTGPTTPAKQARYEIKTDSVPINIPQTEGEATIHDLPSTNDSGNSSLADLFSSVESEAPINDEKVTKPEQTIRPVIDKNDIYQNMDLIQSDMDIFKDLLSNSSLPFNGDQLEDFFPVDPLAVSAVEDNEEEPLALYQTDSSGNDKEIDGSLIQPYNGFPELNDLLDTAESNELNDIFNSEVYVPKIPDGETSDPPTEQVD